MKDTKHIDRVFQEKLKDLEVTPDQSVWDSIEASLNKKDKDRKIIPFWWKLGGVAATLLLMLLIGNLIFNDSPNNPTSPTVVDTEQKDINSPEKQKVNNATIVNSDKEKVPDSNDKENHKTFIDKKETIKSTLKNSYSQQKNNALVNTNNQRLNNPTNSNNPIVNPTKQLAISKENQNILTQTKTTNKETNTNLLGKKEGVAQNKSVTETPLHNNKTDDIANNKNKEGVVDQVEKEKTPLTEDLVLNEENIDEKEKEAINRWQINPNIAPVYFNSLGKGSSIDDQFNNNHKSGNISLSYGVNASYALNDRLSIKTGVNKVNLSYNTDHVMAFQSISPNSNLLFKNVEVSHPTNVTFLSANSISLAQSPVELNASVDSHIKQDLGFIEVPLEMQYSLINKKIGVNIISGFSFLFLSDNNVYSIINDVETLLGEATNINNTSFSANFGLGLDYKISKKVNLNLNPMFKYQLNTFNDTSGNFKPYFIGIYSGLNFKF